MCIRLGGDSAQLQVASCVRTVLYSRRSGIRDVGAVEAAVRVVSAGRLHRARRNDWRQNVLHSFIRNDDDNVASLIGVLTSCIR